MSENRHNEADRVENPGTNAPEATIKTGDNSSTETGVVGQWAAAARDTLYSAAESALRYAGMTGSKPQEAPEHIDFSEKPLLPSEKQSGTKVEPRTAAETFSLPRAESLAAFTERGALPGTDRRTADIFRTGHPGDPFEKGLSSDPFVRGFSFERIGSSLKGSSTDRSDLIKNDSFNFDGLFNADFFSSKSDSKAGSSRFITNLGLDKIGSSLSEYFFSSKDTGPPVADKAAEKGASVVSSAVDSIKRVGSNIIEGADSLINYIFGDSAKSTEKPAGSTERTLTRNSDGSTSLDMQTPENGRLQVHTTDRNIHVESDTHGTIDRTKGEGPQDVKVDTTDGRHFHQDAEGNREASNDRSNLRVEQKGEKVIIKDSSGNQVAEFGSAGDAQRFLDNGEISFVRPGETVEQAAERLKAEQGEAKWKSNNHIITDGKGNVLTIDEHQNTLRRHPNGTIDMHYGRTGEDGQTDHVDVRLTRRNGRTVVSVKGTDGEYHETDQLTARQIQNELRGSDLSWEGDRLCRRHHRRDRGAHEHEGEHRDVPAGASRPGDRPAATTPPSDPVPVVDETTGRVQVTPDTTVDAVTGEVKVKQGDNEITVKADPETGRVVLTESESGRTMTQEADGRLAIQGPEQQDRISFDPSKGELDAWGMLMGRGDTRIRNEDGSSTVVDRLGNFELFDKFDKSLLSAIDNAVKLYDGTEIYEDNSFFDAIEEAMLEQEQREAVQQALAEAYSAMAFAQSVVANSAGVLSAGAIFGQLSGIRAAMDRCLALGICPPGELAIAEARLRNAIPEFDQQIFLQNKLTSELGHVNNALITYARQSGSNDPATAVAYARRLWGGGDAKQA